MNKNITSSKRKAVLIGAGSIGKKHLKILLEKFESIIIVDPNNEVSKYILSFSNANSMTYLSGLAQLENRAKIDLAVYQIGDQIISVLLSSWLQWALRIL